MPKLIEFPFPDDAQLPNIPINLIYTGKTVTANALLDSGASVNVLPYEMGLQLGAVWEQQTIRLPLAGNLAQTEARGLFINIQIGNLDAVKLAFAWTASSQVPLILGQTNFFREFDVCFQRSRQIIEIARLGKD